jgi:hypothetical protein
VSIAISGLSEETMGVLQFLEQNAFGVSTTITSFTLSANGGPPLQVPGLVNQLQYFYSTGDVQSYAQSATTFEPFSSKNVVFCTSLPIGTNFNNFVDIFTTLSAGANSTTNKVKTYNITLLVANATAAGAVTVNASQGTGTYMPVAYTQI